MWEKTISIRPGVAAGEPTLTGHGCPTRVIASRFMAGDDIACLSGDYMTTPEMIEAAIRYEFIRRVRGRTRWGRQRMAEMEERA